MDWIFQLFIDSVKPAGNLFVKYLLPKGAVEKDSMLSIVIGAILIMILIILIVFLILKLPMS